MAHHRGWRFCFTGKGLTKEKLANRVLFREGVTFLCMNYEGEDSMSPDDTIFLNDFSLAWNARGMSFPAENTNAMKDALE